MAVTVDDIMKDLKSNLKYRTPFTEAEMQPDIIDLGIGEALGDINKYRPKIVKSEVELSDPKLTLLRQYSNKFDFNSITPFAEEMEVNFGTAFVYSKKWTVEAFAESMDDISLPNFTYDYFSDLVVAHCGLFMSNHRRKAGMGSLPFDLKGDQFHSEFSDKRDKLIAELINTANNTL